MWNVTSGAGLSNENKLSHEFPDMLKDKHHPLRLMVAEYIKRSDLSILPPD